MNHVGATAPELILLAAESLPSPFTAEALVVTVWQRFPATFGLAGYTKQHPDANKCLASIMGRRGLAARGYLERKGPKLYALTQQGREWVRRLLAGEGAAPVEKSQRAAAKSAAADLDAALRYMLATKAVALYRAGRRQELTFADAGRFWSIGEYADAERIGKRLAGAASAASLLILAGELVLSNGRAATADDGRLLEEVHEYLRGRFSRHLGVLEKRKAV